MFDELPPANGWEDKKVELRKPVSPLCGNCEFWHKAYTQCRRYPPRPKGHWPLTLTTDWCGEWKLKSDF